MEVGSLTKPCGVYLEGHTIWQNQNIINTVMYM